MAIFLLAASGLVAFDFLFDDLEKRELAKNLEITNGSITYRVLTEEGEGLFNITVMSVMNPYEVQYKKAKPRLKTYGPYVYSKIVKKRNLTFSAENGSTYIHFMYYTTYHFNLNLSSDDANETFITVPNLANSIIRYIIDESQGNIGFLAKLFISSKMFINITVNKFLWGYVDSDLSWLSRFNYADSEQAGVLIALNNSISGPYKVNTGIDDISRLGMLESFENKTHLTYWNTDYANMLNGTCDAVTPPSVKLGAKRYMFATNICRSVPFTAKMWVPATNFPKLKLLALELDDAAFESVEERPENAGFHNKSYPGGRYPPSGMWSLGPCILPSVSGNKPLYASLPYFNKAADEIRDAIIFEDGIEPGAISQLKVDPKTGFIIEGTLQYQVNLLIPKKQYGAANDTMYPLALIQEFKAASREDAENLYNTAYAFPETIRMIVRMLFSILAGLAFLLILATVIQNYLDYRAKKEFNDEKVTVIEFDEDDSISDKSLDI